MSWRLLQTKSSFNPNLTLTCGVELPGSAVPVELPGGFGIKNSVIFGKKRYPVLCLLRVAINLIHPRHKAAGVYNNFTRLARRGQSVSMFVSSLAVDHLRAAKITEVPDMIAEITL